MLLFDAVMGHYTIRILWACKISKVAEIHLGEILMKFHLVELTSCYDHEVHFVHNVFCIIFIPTILNI